MLSVDWMLGNERNGQVPGLDWLEEGASNQEVTPWRRSHPYLLPQTRREGKAMKEKSNGSPALNAHLFIWERQKSN